MSVANDAALNEREMDIVKVAAEKYGKSLIETALALSTNPEAGKICNTARTVFFGTKLILGHISDKYCLGNMLSRAFGGDMAADILYLACFIMLDGNALSNNDALLGYHVNPRGYGISSQDAIRLLDDMSEDGCMCFYRLWLKHITEKAAESGSAEKVLHDLTSLSFTGHRNVSAEFGYNRDKESLPQVNYAMLCLRGSGMPLFAWAMNGSIADVA
ncbi:MAG: hypothetical protein LBJ12_09960, partial [Oscillospiraceae bacterium]|nr:hypothetical protein [Oscillospiraceae bacterium]